MDALSAGTGSAERLLLSSLPGLAYARRGLALPVGLACATSAFLGFHSKPDRQVSWRVSGAGGVRKSPKNESAVHERAMGI